jgi:hypothetical protein
VTGFFLVGDFARFGDFEVILLATEKNSDPFFARFCSQMEFRGTPTFASSVAKKHLQVLYFAKLPLQKEYRRADHGRARHVVVTCYSLASHDTRYPGQILLIPCLPATRWV